MRITLTVEAGPHAGHVFEFPEHALFLVGRSDVPTSDSAEGQVLLPHPFHDRVQPAPVPADRHGEHQRTRSTAGWSTTADLHDGDLIKAGKTILRVSHGGRAVPPLPRARTLLAPRDAATIPLPARPSDRPIARSPGSSRPTDHRAAVLGRVRSARPPSREQGGFTGATDPRGHRSALPGLPGDDPAHPQPIAGLPDRPRAGPGRAWASSTWPSATPTAARRPEDDPAGDRRHERAFDRFLREAGILRELDHPNIVAFRDLGEADGLLYFAMDYVPGTDAARCSRSTAAPCRSAAPSGWSARCSRPSTTPTPRGSSTATSSRPTSWSTREGGRETVKLADFGLARLYQASQLSGLTMQGDLGGTAAFMAPEQITHLRQVRPPADQYAAGATLYNLLTDRPIYDLPAPAGAADPDDPARRPGADPRAPSGPPGRPGRDHPSGAGPGAGDRFANVLEMRRALTPYLQ